ncbi:MAG: hypothetical protein JRN32_03510 [Nitrososphaerota archaeon]|jgi:hypothetical protein|nr:hypothetical protein [Nitrososphaerota archaeon]MDG7038590.1 hypothetical protein [Nitrososphaerota archaeon]MDG7043005.1 hypothetical protein [Nitrososphaerota archaeon]MDG7045868.1 hypothetical protein [Nitrososphaerota archaeon]
MKVLPLIAVLTVAMMAGFGLYQGGAYAQTRSSQDPVDRVIGGYSGPIGYSQYQFQWIPTAINSSNINYGGVLLNVPVRANGTETLNGDGTVAAWIQAAAYITSSGTYYPTIEVWALTYDGPPQYSQNPFEYSWASLPISPNGQIAFIELNYTQYASHTGWWFILGLGEGTSPSSLIYMAVLTSSGGVYYLNSRGGYMAGASPGLTAVGNTAAGIQDQGEYVYPSIGLQINENSYGQFTGSNPAFEVYGSFFAGNNYLSNVYYANSSGASADYGLMAGGSSPPTTVAGSGGTFYPPDGGATEYAYAFGTPEGIRSSGQLSAFTQKPGTDLATLNSVTASVINSFSDHDIALSPTYPVIFLQITNMASPALAGAGIPFGIPYRPPWYAIYPYAPLEIIGLISVAAYLVIFLLPKLMRFLQNKSHR